MVHDWGSHVGALMHVQDGVDCAMVRETSNVRVSARCMTIDECVVLSYLSFSPPLQDGLTDSSFSFSYW
jgi:hypothetical protein